MKITISNIAWNKEEDEAIALLLKKYAIGGVEIAPTKIWANPIKESNEAIIMYKKFWENKGIKVSSVQSILFGHPEMNIFTSKESRLNTLHYLREMIRVSAQLGAGVIVFGSPKNRDIGSMKINQAMDIAEDFFYEIGEISQKYNIFFCLEPNPKEYGTNFANTTEEAISIIERVNHPNFMLHLDSGAMTVNKEDYVEAITKGFKYVKHFHISERNLHPLSLDEVDHKKIAKILKKIKYKDWVSIEMRGNNDQSNTRNVESALALVASIYA
jgi:D-psicose/D-tagatose/L-ribulose 3-epimerase